MTPTVQDWRSTLTCTIDVNGEVEGGGDLRDGLIHLVTFLAQVMVEQEGITNG